MIAKPSFKSLLRKVVDNRGKTCPVADTGIPLIATNCVKNTTLYPVFEKIRYVSADSYNNWFRGHPEPGDMIFVTKGSPGEVCWVPDPVGFCIAQDMVAIRADEEKVYPKYLFAALRSPSVRHDIDNMHVGTLIPHFKKGDFDKLYIPLPSRTTQEAIGDLYFALCKKIELNRQTNETLEAMARAIFKDWFVDFGPTRAKAEGREPYLSPELWDLFPDALDDEDKPVGWEVGSISDLADTNSQSWTARNHPTYVEYVDLSNAKWGGIDAITTLPWEEAPSRARRIAKAGDTIVGTTRPGNGSFAYISKDGLTVSTGFAVLSPRESAYSDVVYIAATRPDNIDRLANLADGHGGAYPAVKPKEVSDTELVLPGDAILNAFAELVSPLREKIEHAKAESRSLAQTRDLLLPKLMSGEIRMRDAEKAVEAVA